MIPYQYVLDRIVECVTYMQAASNIRWGIIMENGGLVLSLSLPDLKAPVSTQRSFIFFFCLLRIEFVWDTHLILYPTRCCICGKALIRMPILSLLNRFLTNEYCSIEFLNNFAVKFLFNNLYNFNFILF